MTNNTNPRGGAKGAPFQGKGKASMSMSTRSEANDLGLMGLNRFFSSPTPFSAAFSAGQQLLMRCFATAHGGHRELCTENWRTQG